MMQFRADDKTLQRPVKREWELLQDDRMTSVYRWSGRATGGKLQLVGLLFQIPAVLKQKKVPKKVPKTSQN